MKYFGFYLIKTNPVVDYVKCAEAAVKASAKIRTTSAGIGSSSSTNCFNFFARHPPHFDQYLFKTARDPLGDGKIYEWRSCLR